MTIKQTTISWLKNVNNKTVKSVPTRSSIPRSNPLFFERSAEGIKAQLAFTPTITRVLSEPCTMKKIISVRSFIRALLYASTSKLCLVPDAVV